MAAARKECDAMSRGMCHPSKYQNCAKGGTIERLTSVEDQQLIETLESTKTLLEQELKFTTTQLEKSQEDVFKLQNEISDLKEK